jgi:hypothetical protein
MAPDKKAVVLTMYKNMLRVAKGIPNAQSRLETIDKIRHEFRHNSTQSDPAAIETLLTQANSNLGYLKIVTPRKSGQQTGRTTLVFSNHFSAAHGIGEGKAVSNWTGKNIDPDSMKRHLQGLKRAGFKSHAQAKGVF